MEIEIIETEVKFEQIEEIENNNKIEKYDTIENIENSRNSISGFEISIPLEPIEILLKYFICSICDGYFDSKYKLERHKIGKTFNQSESRILALGSLILTNQRWSWKFQQNTELKRFPVTNVILSRYPNNI